MKVFVTGEREDVVGFALAGVEPLPENIPADAIVIQSQSVAAADHGRRAPEAGAVTPFVVVLPEPR